MTTKNELLNDVIRGKCLDCTVRQPGEVRKCTVYSCKLYPFRMGKDPFPSRKANFTPNSTPSTQVSINLSTKKIPLTEEGFSAGNGVVDAGNAANGDVV